MLGWLGRLNDGCRCVIELLGDGVVIDRLGVDGAGDLGADRLILGDGLRVGVRDCVGRLMRGPIDRVDRVEGRETELRVLREGRLRCGVERETDGADRLGVDRLGADRVVCRLDELRLLLLRELRDDRCASAAEASSNAATTAMATPTAMECDFFFVEYI